MPRAVTPVLGAVLLVGVTVVLVAVVAVAVTGFAPAGPTEPVVLDATAASATGEVTIEHVSGPPLDVRNVALRVEIDGEPLAHQPPVPFFAATGFVGGPSGPFNSASDPAWSAGESGSFRVASTNHPPLVAGAELEVSVIRDDRVLVRVTTTID